MDDKKIFKMLVLYLKSNAITECHIEVNYWGEFESLSYSKISDDDTNRKISIIPEFEKWLDNYIENFDTDFFYGDNDYSENGGLVFYINLDKLTMTIRGYYYEQGTESAFSETDFDDLRTDYQEKLSEYIKEGVTEIKVYYSGGGDSGQVDSMEIDGNSADLNGIIEDISYTMLSDFGGWEINEGSQGYIEFDMVNKSASVHHEWNNEEVITKEIEVINLI